MKITRLKGLELIG
ncbi:hypothetical protein LINPERHAP2_LOCUS12082 [Linum perenne]